MLTCVLTIIFEIFKPMAKYSGALIMGFFKWEKAFSMGGHNLPPPDWDWVDVCIGKLKIVFLMYHKFGIRSDLVLSTFYYFSNCKFMHEK